MEYICLGFNGLEKAVEFDVKEYFDAKSVKIIDSGVVFFMADQIKDISPLQCIKQGLELYSTINKKNLSVNNNEINKENLAGLIKIINGFSKFKIKIIRNEQLEKEKSQEIQNKIASVILENTEAKVDLKKPDVLILVIVSEENLYIGKNIGENKLEDYSKREYKLYNSGNSLDPAFAYSCFKTVFINSSKKDEELKMIVPFCGTGALPIEIALYMETKKRKYTINAYDIQSFLIRSAKSNAKLAYIVDNLEFEKESIENLSKIHGTEKNNKGNMFFAKLPSPAKRVSENSLDNLYMKTLDQIDSILENNSKVGIIIENPEQFLKVLRENKKYDNIKEDNIYIGYQGQLKHYIIELEFKE